MFYIISFYIDPLYVTIHFFFYFLNFSFSFSWFFISVFLLVIIFRVLFSWHSEYKDELQVGLVSCRLKCFFPFFFYSCSSYFFLSSLFFLFCRSTTTNNRNKQLKKEKKKTYHIFSSLFSLPKRSSSNWRKYLRHAMNFAPKYFFLLISFTLFIVVFVALISEIFR